MSLALRNRLARLATAAFVLALASEPLLAQETGSVVSEKGIATPSNRFRLKGEIKAHFRSSTREEQKVAAIGPPEPIFLRTVSPHGSFEISTVTLIGEADLTPDISAKTEIHFLDLYNRNPTSSDDRIAVREAWIRFGKKLEVLQAIPGTTLYLQVGKAPRFSKQLQRRLESYGLWGTAVGRFEEVGIEAGGTFGRNVYWRGSLVNGNPLFYRDPNALAGDNGTPERMTFGPGSNPVYQSGFPILYDAKSTDLNFQGKFQYGGGLGFRFLFGEENRSGVDVLGWYFRRQLAQSVPIRGSFYGGDLELLRGFPGGPSLAVSGDDKWEAGANLEVHLGGFQLYGQWVYQEIAGLPRKGFEVEGSYRIPLNGVFVSGDTPVLNWIQFVARASKITNDFKTPPGFIDPSMGWNWNKWDGGFRLGVVRGVDLTAEYARHDVILAARVAHFDEFLSTLRAGF